MEEHLLVLVLNHAGNSRAFRTGASSDLSAGLRQLKPSLDEAGEDHEGLNSRE